MAVTYSHAPDVVGVVRRVVTEVPDHAHLSEADIACVFRSEPAKSGGKENAATIRKAGDRDRLLHGKDLVLEVAKPIWDGMTEAQREALVDHELCHVAEAGADEDTGRMKWAIVAHDVEEFAAVIERRGLWAPHVRRFGEVVQKCFEFAAEPAAAQAT